MAAFGFGVASAHAAPAVLDLDHPSIRAAQAVQAAITPDVMRWAGVLGTAVGADEAGAVAVIVYVDEASPAKSDVVRALPPELRGQAVRVEATDRIVAMAGKPGGGGGGGLNPRAPQTFPIQLGTSGGWGSDLANGFCCGGTLGALLTANGVQYILSNYHVLEADIVGGGNGMVATTGSSVIQPGLIDVNCNAASAGVVGTLVKIASLPGSNVDAAIAQVAPGAVRTDGAILGIGTLTSAPIGASVNQAVKKTGRTTGLTRSVVSGLNANISVTYENECGGGTAFTKTFTGQIVIKNRRSAFLNSGDSGSLMVQDVTTAPRPVGLLYAGSSTLAIANPIGEVLQYVGTQLNGATVSVVGQ